MSLPARPCRPAPLPRPDPEALLLTAIRRRDPQVVSRVVQQLVHRRGVGALEIFQRTTLPGVEGEEACRWFERLLAFPAENFSAIRVGEEHVPAAAESVSSADSLFAGVLQPEPAHLASLAAIDPWALPPPGPAEPILPLQSEAATLAPTGRSPWVPRFGFVRAGLAGGRRSLAGVRSLLRDCFDEALVNVHQEAPEEVSIPVGEDDDPVPGGSNGETQAMPSVPAQLPQLADTSPQEGPPAPAPPALSDLRAWLPDSGDLPRAC